MEYCYLTPYGSVGPLITSLYDTSAYIESPISLLSTIKYICQELKGKEESIVFT